MKRRKTTDELLFEQKSEGRFRYFFHRLRGWAFATIGALVIATVGYFIYYGVTDYYPAFEPRAAGC